MSPSRHVRPTLPVIGQIAFWIRAKPVLFLFSFLSIASVVTVGLAWDRIVALSENLERSRARSFFERGLRAWHEGAAGTARLCFETALAIDPSNLEAALTLGRLQLQQGNREQARAVFQDSARRFPVQLSNQIALVYHDSLIGSGWWEELAVLGLEKLASVGRPEPLWLNAALEGTRLKGWTKADLDVRLDALPLDGTSRRLVLAQAAVNEGQPHVARDLLGPTKVPLTPDVAWVAARIWRRAGAMAEARVALARTQPAIGPEMKLLTDYWLMQDEQELQARQFGLIVSRAFTPPTTPLLIPSVVNLTLAQGQGGNSELLRRELRRRRPNLAPQTIAALWLLALREQNEAIAAAWLADLREAIDNPPVLKDLNALNEKTFLLVAGSLPLSRDTLYALLFTLSRPGEKSEAESRR